jgi:prepilin-type N-terminal cleavage/methylation domain-containing protein
MERKTNASRAGFTLIELIVVIVILGVIAAIIIPSFTRYIEKAKEQACAENLINLTQGFLAEINSNPARSESDESFQVYINANYGGPITCPSDNTILYTWDKERHSALCPHHGLRIYDIVLASSALQKTMQEITSSFDNYLKVWTGNGNQIPIVNSVNASLSWNSANYTGTDKTNIFQAKFWNDYYKFVNVTGFNSSNAAIADFKVFFKRDTKGVVTSELAGVYLQIGGSSMIRFSDGTVVTNKHYSNYIDPNTKQLKPPQ